MLYAQYSRFVYMVGWATFLSVVCLVQLIDIMIFVWFDSQDLTVFLLFCLPYCFFFFQSLFTAYNLCKFKLQTFCGCFFVLLLFYFFSLSRFQGEHGYNTLSRFSFMEKYLDLLNECFNLNNFLFLPLLDVGCFFFVLL